MARYRPDQRDRCDRVDQRQQKATVECRRRPQRRGGLESEGMWKQRAIRHADIAEEPLNPIKKGAQAAVIDTCRDIFARKALAKRVVSLTGGISLSGCAGGKHPKMPSVHQRKGERAKPTDDRENGRERYRQIARSPGHPAERGACCAENCGADNLEEFAVKRLISHPRCSRLYRFQLDCRAAARWLRALQRDLNSAAES